MFKLEFSTDNSAFEQCTGDEVARILFEVGTRMQDQRMRHAASGTICDANGNRIGSWSYEPSEGGEGQGDD